MYTLKNGLSIKKFDIYINPEGSIEKEPGLRDTITLKETHDFVSFDKIYSEDYDKWDSLE